MKKNLLTLVSVICMLIVCATGAASTPAILKDGRATTPTTPSTYSSDVDYNLGAITIPGACIAGQISSSSTPINGSIKTRCNQALTMGTGFYFNVNPNYAITSVKIEGCSNQTEDNDCIAVYIDGEKNDMFSSATLPLAVQNGSTGIILLNNIFATKKIEFLFGKNYQAQMNITVEYVVSEYKTVNPTVGYGTLYYPNKNLVIPEGMKAYAAYLEGSTLTLDEIEEGIINAGTAVIYTGSGLLTPTSESGVDYEDNDLKGVSEDTPTSSITGGIVTVLGYENNKTAFYRYTGASLSANKAYLVVNDQNAAKSITITFAPGASASGSTSVGAAVSEPASHTTPQKLFRNNTLHIKTAQGIVNAAGAYVE